MPRAIRVLAPSVYSFLCGKKPCDIVVPVDEVSDEGVRENLLNKVSINNLAVIVVG